MTKTNEETILKSLNSDIDAIVKDSHGHAKKFANIVVRALLFAAEHGQCGPMTRLHKEVSNQDAEGMRVFVVNMTEKYGPMVTGEDGTDRRISFLKFKKDTGFSLNTSGNETVSKAIKAMKAAVIKAGLEKLAEIPFGKIDRDAGMADAFNSVAAIQRLIRTLARNGDGSHARAINRVLGAGEQLTVGEIDELANKGNIDTKIEKARKALEKLETQKDSMVPANANATAPAASAAVN